MSSIGDIISAVERGERTIHVGGIYGSAKAYLLARLAEHLPGRPIVMLCPTEDEAQTLITDAQMFLPESSGITPRLFPDADVMPYLKLSPEPVRWADRIEILYELAHHRPVVLATSATAATRFAPPLSFVANAARAIRMKDTLDRDEFARWLTLRGYVDVGLVEDEGSFAVRGGIIDVWTPTIDEPLRIELEGDTVADMRRFDPASQRSRGEVREAIILPAGDICFTPDETQRALNSIKRRAEEREFPAQEKRRVLDMVREHIAFAGIESLSPLFHETAATLADYLPPQALVIIDEPEEVRGAHAAHLEKLNDLHRASEAIETLVAPEELYRSIDAVIGDDASVTRLRLTATEVLPRDGVHAIQVATQPTVDIRTLVAQHKPDEDQLSPLIIKLDEWKRAGLHAMFVCHTDIQAERIIDLFRWQGTPLAAYHESIQDVSKGTSLKPGVIVGRLSEGFIWPEEKIAIVTDEEIFGRKARVRTATKQPIEHFTSFAELAEGDFLVHENHGVGRYTGLRHLSIEDLEGDYLLLEYLGGDKLYLPVYRMNLVQRYIGSGDTAPALDRLGGTRWSRVTKSVRRSIMAMAKDLLRIHAAREVYPGFRYPSSDNAYEEFCAAFPYDETPDQLTSIDDVVRDMESERPSDRLICGDVGYGKTEVAMRAAFKAAMAGKQVAVLVPTTVLALQHYETFTARFAGTPIKIEMLSRFRTQAQQKKIIAEVRGGTMDILIGTHRMLSKDIGFKDLGLIIVDEEQRFGVKHKERLKKFRETVDIITLTATPIPRTLHLSLVGIRDVSVINTPPANRQSIATHVIPFDEPIIRHAIMNEIERGGQVFFVHNRVQTMPSMIAGLKRLVPEASMRMAHGQMSEHELEDVMIGFLEKEFNVLVCTAIIESGLDIPSANTIIVNRADTFGLAQLYQLRGRVGRSNVKACAYLLTPQDAPITPAAKKRLMVLKRFTELGSGFQIANHDLEIRGAGNILGAAQSGHIAQVGYELYTKLLARAIRKLSGKEVVEDIDPELRLKVEGFFPESYIEDAGTRLDCYRRLATAENAQRLDDIAQELVDRFGPLPTEAAHLVAIMSIKLAAQRLRIRQFTFDGRVFGCQLDESTPLDVTKAAQLVIGETEQFRLYPPDRILMMTRGITDPSAILDEARKLLSTLESCANPGANED